MNIIIIIIGTNMGHKICSKVTSSNSHLEYCGTENNKILIFFTTVYYFKTGLRKSFDNQDQKKIPILRHLCIQKDPFR